MVAQSPRPVALDAGALIALERGSPFVRQLLRDVIRTKGRLLVPAPVLGQVWRASARQAPIAALLKRAEVSVFPLDENWAKACGVLLGKHKSEDVVDAMVVLLARRHRAAIVTSDPEDLRHLDKEAKLYVV